MSVNNLNLIFNKTYYDDIGKDDFTKKLEGKNAQIFNTEFHRNRDYSAINEKIVPHRFLMKTTYPGLMIGAGYAHGSGIDNANDDINVGFSLDYVTGMPYIPASSVKGVLRSAFKHDGFVEDILKLDASVNVKELEVAIFGSDKDKTDGDDIFFDAVIYSSEREDRHILDDDYITPHKEKTKNPIPILVMKVPPDVVFEFRFCLTDSKIGNVVIKAEDKEKLFIEILSVLGIGAKTNVGYGYLLAFDANR